MEMKERMEEQHMHEGNVGNVGALTSLPNSCTSMPYFESIRKNLCLARNSEEDESETRERQIKLN